MSTRIKACLLDFDGTIADSMMMVLQIYNSIADDLGLPPIDASEVPRLRRLGPLKAIEEYRVPLWKVPMVMARVRRDIEKKTVVPAAFPGLRELFEAEVLKKLRAMIVSSNSRANIERFLSFHGILGVERIDSGASLFGKARRLRRLLQVLQLAPAEVVYVGDEVRDIEAAADTGIVSIAVTWGYGDRTSLLGRGPHHLVDSAEELKALLERLVTL